ncbi:MAG: hypothetical protein ACM3JI_00715 [Anaerolineae bacterium]
MSFSTVLTGLYYIEQAATAAMQAWEAYNKVKILKENPSPKVIDYVDCSLSCVSATLSSTSLGLLAQRDYTSYQKNVSQEASKAAIQDLQQKTDKMSKAVEKAQEELAKTPTISEVVKEKILKRTAFINIAGLTEALTGDPVTCQALTCDLQSTQQDLDSFRRELKVTSIAVSKELSDTLKDTTKALSDCTQGYRNLVTLDVQLRQIQDRERMVHMFSCFSQVLKEGCQDQCFSSMKKNKDIARSGLEAYIAYYPEGEVSQFVKKLCESKTAQREAISLMSWSLGVLAAKMTRIFQSPPSIDNAIQDNNGSQDPGHQGPEGGSHAPENRRQNNALEPMNPLDNNNSVQSPLPNAIPADVEEDPIFQKYICCINQLPARYPMILTAKDGTEFLFDEENILAWCATCENHNQSITNPVTREVFDMNESLKIDEEGRAAIKRRLEELRPFWDIKE